MFEVKYDYDSVLHYSSHAFAANKQKPTIIALKPLGKAKMGQRERMSQEDITRINNMYCKNTLNDEVEDEETPEVQPWD